MRREAEASPVGAISGGRRALPRLWAKLLLAGAAVAALVALTSPAAQAVCPNEEFRVGASALLPDCRAYEIVTPTKLNALPEAGMGPGAVDVRFTSPSVNPSGESLLWKMAVANVPGTESNGTVNFYLAQRSGDGWDSSRKGPNAFQATSLEPGSYTPDYGYTMYLVDGGRGGSLAFCSCFISYVQYPDGSFHLLGEGTIPTDTDTDGFENGFVDNPFAAARWITADGAHQIFISGGVELLPDAPASGIYDRTPSGLKLVSLLPGEVTPTLESEFAGASEDGSTVLFTNEENLYARVNNEKTLAIASAVGGFPWPGGVNQDGSRAFFQQEGDLFYFDVEEEAVHPIVEPGDATLVNVSSDGSHAYFISPTALVPGQGTPGSPNLYVWDGDTIAFVATVEEEDVANGFPVHGLGVWTPIMEPPRSPATNASRILNTSRATRDGGVLVFESKAKLTDYPNEGHIEIYRYVAASNELTCVSCNPAQPVANADNRLVAFAVDEGPHPLGQFVDVANLSADGQHVVFESYDSLLSRDVNGVRDVYSWRSGQLSLISTGQSSQPSGLMGATPDAGNIFFATGEKLVPGGQETGGIAIYDARVDGGLASQQGSQLLPCMGEACQGQPSVPPALALPGSSELRGAGNVKAKCRRRHHAAKTHSGKAKKAKKKRGCQKRRRGANK